MKLVACSLLLLLGCFLPLVLHAGWEESGSFRSLNLHLENSPYTHSGYANLSANRVRLVFERRVDDGGGFEFALENLAFYTDNPGRFPTSATFINRRFDLEKDWRRNRHLSDQLQVGRLNLRMIAGRSELTVGRQAIGFGRIALFSPLDMIAPFAPDALDTDVRPGVDALRWSYFADSGAEYRLAMVAGDEKRHNSALATMATNLANIDLLIVGGQLRSRSALGFGLAGDFGGVGLKVEAVHYQGDRVGQAGGDLHDDFALAGLELWVGSGDMSFVAEYFYNGSGVGRAQNYPWAAVSAPVTEGLTYLLGRHYLLLSPGYQIHPLLSVQALMIWNLQDGSATLRPLLNWSLSDNLAVQLFWTFARGKEPEATIFPGVKRMRSEFGSVGESGGLFLEYYF